MCTQTDYDKEFIKRITQILENNLENEHFGVSELADAAAVSRSQLHRKVHAYNGNSTSQFIREYRLKKAMEILHKNGETVAEVAYKVGFSSPTYFNTCFKDYYGYSPGEAKYHEVNSEHKFFHGRKVWFLSFAFILAVLLGLTSFYYLTPESKELEENVSIAPAEISIAVLPFKNWSGDPEKDYISDGMTDAIISRLTRIGSISKVVPFTSVVAYKQTTKNIPTIAEELEVQHILDGNIQFSGDQIRVSLQLIDGESDAHIWSHEYSGTWLSSEVFDIQSDVAENVAMNMDLHITNEEYNALQKIPTQDKEAYNYWLKAKHQALKYTRDGMANAVPMFENAIRLDSTFVEPYIDLAYLYLFGGASWGLYTEHQAWFKAKELLLKATELDNTNHRLKTALNDGLYMYEWDFGTMEKNYKENSQVGIIYCLQTGKFDEAMTMINMFYEEHPTAVYLPVFKAQTMYFLGQTNEAMDILANTNKLHSDHIMYLRLASRIYYYLGEYEHSIALLSKIINNYPERPPVVLWLYAVNAHALGELELANEYLEELNAQYEDGNSGSPAWFTALYYSSIGDRENAFKWLQNSYDRHEMEMIWLREEPALRSLRGDKRYRKLYKKVGFPMPQHDAD